MGISFRDFGYGRCRSASSFKLKCHYRGLVSCNPTANAWQSLAKLVYDDKIQITP